LAVCVILARADIDAVRFERADGFWGNVTADGDDKLVHFEGDLVGFEPLSGLFSIDHKFEVLGSCAGVCQNTATHCSSSYQTGKCPGSSSYKCCPMATPSCSGQCQDTSLPCGTGYQTGKCPGASNIKCCPSGGGGGGGGGGNLFSGGSTARQGVYTAAMAIYNQRSHEHYTQGSQRWSGITGHVEPPNAPPYSDCSSAATWAYWTVFGNGPDLLNGQSWKAGYTGTMSSRGVGVSCSSMGVGDLAFYGSPISHVAIGVGGGKVVSHGSDPAGLYSVNYRSDLNQCRSYIH